MNSFDRVMAALRHQEADRVPLDVGGMTISSIASPLLKQLLEHFGLEVDFPSPDSIQRIGTPPLALRTLLGIDTVRVGPPRVPEPEGLRAWEQPSAPIRLTDQWGILWEMRPGDHYFHQLTYPLGDGELSEALGHFVRLVPGTKMIASIVRDGLKGRGEAFPVVDRDCAGLFEMSQRLRGMQEFLMDLLLDRESTEALAEALFDYKIAYWDAVLDGVGEEPCVVAEADDYGAENALLISPSLVRDIYLTRLKALITHIKKRAPQVKVCFHSCGAIRPIIPDLIDAGVDALNPVQYIAAGMELEGLKKDFGKDLVFWGGCIDTTRILPYGTPGEVRDEVRRVLDIMAPGGGFVATTVHNLQADVPLANALAYFEALSGY